MGNDDVLHLGEVQGSSTAGGAAASSDRHRGWLEAASFVELGDRSDAVYWSSLITQSRAITQWCCSKAWSSPIKYALQAERLQISDPSN